MQSFKFNVPTVVYFGRNEFERSGKVARNVGKHALVVIGKGSIKKNGYLDKLLYLLSKEGIKSTVFEGIEPNPRSKTINAGGLVAKNNECDFVIALGGGSVMDASKGIAAVAKSGEDVWNYCGRRDFSPKRISDALPLICIPTLAATGSEVNGGAVISNSDTQQKSVIHNEKLIPKYSIVDPVLTMTAPIEYVIDGATDIICHCIETYLSSKTDNDVQDYFTLSLVRTAKKSIDEIISQPKELIEGRDNLCWSSSMAMTGILNGRRGGWPIHEIEHTLSGLYDISHGRGLAILIPAMMRFNLKHNQERIKRLIGFALYENPNYYGNSDGNIAITEFENWMKKINALPENLDSLCRTKIDPQKIAQITIDVYGDNNGQIFNIIPMASKEIADVISKICITKS